MDLVSAFKPILVVTIEELSPKTKIADDVLKKCLAVLDEKYETLVDLRHNAIYIKGGIK